jgi:hypothetical protein
LKLLSIPVGFLVAAICATNRSPAFTVAGLAIVMLVPPELPLFAPVALSKLIAANAPEKLVNSKAKAVNNDTTALRRRSDVALLCTVLVIWGSLLEIDEVEEVVDDAALRDMVLYLWRTAAT